MAIDKKVSYEMQGKVKNYLGNQKMVKAPLHWRSGPKHPSTELAYITKAEKDLLIKKDLHKSLKGGVNRGPSGIISLNGWGSTDSSQNRAGSSISAGMDKSASDAGWSGTSAARHGSSQKYNTAMSPADLSLLAGKKGSSTVMPESHYGRKYKAPGQGFGIGNLFRGALSMFGGVPGKLMSLLSHINPNKLRGKNPDGSWRTQEEYEDDRTNRINQKNIDRILNRKAPITEMTYKNLARYGMKPEDMPAVGSTPQLRAGNKLNLLTDRVAQRPDMLGEFGFKSSVVGTPNTNIISDYPNYRTSNLGGTQQFNRFNNVGVNDMWTMNADQAQAMADSYGMGTGNASNLNNLYNYRADGGRIGYAGGELVTDESMMEATPAGMMQENVEEVQGEPSREQLEALALEIFQLPLEELNEEQLMVVYQAAMEEQPREEMMQEEDIQFAAPRQPVEEAVQEEDIQYAAQGGLAGLL